KAATCTESGWEAYQTCSRCDYTTYTEIPKLPHGYTSARFNWNGYECEAEVVCSCGHTETAECSTELTVTLEPTPEAEGILTITATVSYEGLVFTDIKTESIPRLGIQKPETVLEKIRAFFQKIIEWFGNLFRF
ncbi:MAG: hypothetical protein MJ177_09610, partial [Clostridia bacterium]|nr:hypothetical protein [Clostridia bacterium]